MQQHCDYCEKEFTTERKDKRYCSPSCKQMAYVQRNNNVGVKTHPDTIVSIPGVFKTSSANYAGGVGDDLKQTLKSQNVNAEKLKIVDKNSGEVEHNIERIKDTLKQIQKIKTTDTKQQLSSQTIDGSTQKVKSKRINTSNFNTKEINYVPVKCKWIEEIYQSYYERKKSIQFQNMSTVFKEKKVR